MISKRRILPLILLTGLLAGCGGPEDGDVLEEPGTRENGAEGYGAYTMVVTAWDTPGEVIEELRSLGTVLLSLKVAVTVMMALPVAT